jgi:UDP-glucose 4-epimerase
MEKLKDERILITGGAGFVGSNLVQYLAGKNLCDLVVIDDESLGKRENIGPYDYEFIKADIRDTDTVRNSLKGVTCLVHLAADTRVMDSIEDPVKNFEVNVVGTFNLLELARHAGIKKIVFASTGGAILGEATPPISEDMVACPLAPYGASKLAAEGYLSAYAGSYGMQATSLRFSNIYGPGSYHKGSVVAHFFKRILSGDDIIVYGDGNQKRDYLFVFDLMQGIEAAIQTNTHGVYQLGTGKPTSVNELLDSMKKITGEAFQSKIIYEDFRQGEIMHTWCDISKARKELGFLPDTTLENGLRQTWEWFLQNYKVSP